MKGTKDLFSKQAETYARFRPVYPQGLFNFLFSITQKFDAAWDCATGNGQVANVLSERFRIVHATDISEQQLTNAVKKHNIIYEVARAEKTPFPDNSFDLITVGTALHWFDIEYFYLEAKRVAKPGAHLAAWAYAPFRSQDEVDKIIDRFCYQELKDYWDEERHWVDEEYKTLPFPFVTLETPMFEIRAMWSFEHVIGYLNSWSAVQHYIDRHGINPVEKITPELRAVWPEDQQKEIWFPLFLKVGRIDK